MLDSRLTGRPHGFKTQARSFGSGVRHTPVSASRVERVNLERLLRPPRPYRAVDAVVHYATKGFQRCRRERASRTVLVAQFEFVEWTDVNHLRHTKFVGLRDNEKAKDIVRE